MLQSGSADHRAGDGVMIDGEAVGRGMAVFGGLLLGLLSDRSRRVRRARNLAHVREAAQEDDRDSDADGNRYHAIAAPCRTVCNPHESRL